MCVYAYSGIKIHWVGPLVVLTSWPTDIKIMMLKVLLSIMNIIKIMVTTRKVTLIVMKYH